MNIEIYSKQGCIYCDKSKSFLHNRGYIFTEHCFDATKNNYIQKRDTLFNKYNHASFPIIVINNIFIGGYTQLINYKFPLVFDNSF